MVQIKAIKKVDLIVVQAAVVADTRPGSPSHGVLQAGDLIQQVASPQSVIKSSFLDPLVFTGSSSKDVIKPDALSAQKLPELGFRRTPKTLNPTGRHRGTSLIGNNPPRRTLH